MSVVGKKDEWKCGWKEEGGKRDYRMEGGEGDGDKREEEVLFFFFQAGDGIRDSP